MKNISISLFKGYSDTLPAEVTLQQVVNLIKNDTSVREHTEKHRYYAAQGQTNAAAREKSSCPCFAVAVRFKNGKQKDHITGWTGLSLVDIDHVAAGRLSQLLEVIRADKHTLIAYRTIGGFGIRIIFPTDYVSDNFGRNLKAYANVFEQTNLYYAQLLNAECDLKCKNATRLSGLAYDPDVFFNPEATPFHIEAKVTKKALPHPPTVCKNP